MKENRLLKRLTKHTGVQHTVTREEKWSSSEPHTNCGRCRCRL